MKWLLFALAIGYVLIALVSRAKEAAGLLTCSCYPDCWCTKPGLSLFRWVFPRFQHNPEIEAWKKQQLDPSARLRFVGSPTILIEGRDPFGDAEEGFGLSCRVYKTPDGLAGSPTFDQLRATLREALTLHGTS